jgi:hypothetical protein
LAEPVLAILALFKYSKSPKFVCIVNQETKDLQLRSMVGFCLTIKVSPVRGLEQKQNSSRRFKLLRGCTDGEHMQCTNRQKEFATEIWVHDTLLFKCIADTTKLPTDFGADLGSVSSEEIYECKFDGSLPQGATVETENVGRLTANQMNRRELDPSHYHTIQAHPPELLIDATPILARLYDLFSETWE